MVNFVQGTAHASTNSVCTGIGSTSTRWCIHDIRQPQQHNDTAMESTNTSCAIVLPCVIPATVIPATVIPATVITATIINAIK